VILSGDVLEVEIAVVKRRMCGQTLIPRSTESCLLGFQVQDTQTGKNPNYVIAVGSESLVVRSAVTCGPDVLGLGTARRDGTVQKIRGVSRDGI
jgi:hypothetical protein